MFRHPRTTAERRAACAAKADGIKVRPSRNFRNLPNEWDEILLSDSHRAKRRGQRKSDKRVRATPTDEKEN